MSKCLLCNSNFRNPVNYEKLFLFIKPTKKYTCDDCLQKFSKKKGPFCTACNKDLNVRGLCVDCIQWEKMYRGKLLDNRSLYKYNDAFHDLMVQYKRYGDYVLCNVLADLVDKLPEADYYVPLPTSPSHLQTRGFDTVFSIYKNLVPLTELLTKVDTEVAQGEKNRKERLLTKQTFSAIKKENIEGKILILDDIYTTGRTLYHARDALLEVYPNCKINSFTISR